MTDSEGERTRLSDWLGGPGSPRSPLELEKVDMIVHNAMILMDSVMDLRHHLEGQERGRGPPRTIIRRRMALSPPPPMDSSSSDGD